MKIFSLQSHGGMFLYDKICQEDLAFLDLSMPNNRTTSTLKKKKELKGETDNFTVTLEILIHLSN